MYITASGHLITGETIEEAFRREIKEELGINIIGEKTFKFEDFLVNKGETGIEKYGNVLNKIIELTN